MEEESYPTVFLAEVLCRLLPEKVLELDVFFFDGKGNEVSPRQEALRVVKKVAVEEISGAVFSDVLYWVLRLLRKILECGDQPLPAFETVSMVVGMNEVLVDFFWE